MAESDFVKFEIESVKYHAAVTGQWTCLWAQVPEWMLYECGYITDYHKHRLARLTSYREGGNPFTDYGVDAIACESSSDTRVFHILQMKHYPSGKRITAGDLGTTFAVKDSLRIRNYRSKAYLYYHGILESRLEACLLGNPEWVVLARDAVARGVVGVAAAVIPINVPTKTQFTLRQHQHECLLKLDAGFEGPMSIISPCGTGKTVILNEFARRHYTKVVYVSPHRAHAEQNLERYRSYIGSHMACKLVDSDGTRNLDELRAVINGSGGWMLSSTYTSAEDVLLELFEIGEGEPHLDVLLIIDEVHNAETRDKLRMLSLCFHQTIGATATPMADSFWEEIYSYSLDRAIADGVVCDYKIYLPETTDITTGLPVEFDGLDDIGRDLVLQSTFLLDGLLKTGSRRCLVMLSTIEQCQQFQPLCQKVGIEYHGFQVGMAIITAETSAKERRRILDDFQIGGVDIIKIIINIRILMEAIDIPRCDSVFLNRGFFTNHAKPVQAAFRAIRKDPGNPTKVANIFIWSDCNVGLVNTLQALKQVDANFGYKVGYIARDYDGQMSATTAERLNQQSYSLHESIAVKSVSLDELKQRRIDELMAYWQKEHKWPPSHTPLGKWLSNQRTAFKNGILSSNMITQLNSIDPSWIGRTTTWEERHQELKAYRSANPGSWPPRKEPLGTWLSNQRTAFRNRKLSEDRIVLLNSIDPSWIGRTTTWEERCQELKVYRCANPGSWPSQKEPLGVWLNNQRTAFKNRKLLEDRIALLNSIDPSWIGTTTTWEERCQELKAYRSANPGSWPPRREPLGNWLHHQRIAFKNRKLLEDRIVLLNSIDLSWIGRTTTTWEERHQELKVYRCANPGSWPPRREPLGDWLSQQRTAFKNRKLSVDRITLLDAIDSSWVGKLGENAVES